jgi:two-component system CheB/CheR fusion protein
MIQVDPPLIGASSPARSHLVALGASAGGLDALSRLFDQLPSDTGAAFVVIQHLSSDHPTLMDTLLARHTRMPVAIAQEGDLCLANRVLLIPPGKHINLVDGRIALSPKPLHGIGLPIDEFLVSAAREWGGRVVCQSADSAEFDGMPNNAMATGVVDQLGSCWGAP